MLKKVLGKKVNKREEPTSPGNTPAAGADRHAALFGACQEVSLSADDARCHCDLVLARVGFTHSLVCRLLPSLPLCPASQLVLILAPSRPHHQVHVPGSINLTMHLDLTASAQSSQMGLLNVMVHAGRGLQLNGSYCVLEFDAHQVLDRLWIATVVLVVAVALPVTHRW